LPAKSPGILDGAEIPRKTGTTLQGFNLGFRARIIAGDVRSVMGFGYPKIGQQQGDVFDFILLP